MDTPSRFVGNRIGGIDGVKEKKMDGGGGDKGREKKRKKGKRRREEGQERGEIAKGRG